MQPSLAGLIIPITVVIIVGLFAVQRRGTAAVGRVFGPVMIAWFLAIAWFGVAGITRHPDILKALSPTYALGFLAGHIGVAFFALAAIVLAVTGAEALYTDMGHFGRRAITRAWLILVFPACVLSYLGQGALILDDPSNISSPFFLLVPEWGRLAMVVLATAATEGDLHLHEASYYLSKIELRRGDEPTMAPWRKRLFIATSYITADAAEHFALPRDRTVIMGSHIDI